MSIFSFMIYQIADHWKLMYSKLFKTSFNIILSHFGLLSIFATYEFDHQDIISILSIIIFSLTSFAQFRANFNLQPSKFKLLSWNSFTPYKPFNIPINIYNIYLDFLFLYSAFVLAAFSIWTLHMLLCIGNLFDSPILISFQLHSSTMQRCSPVIFLALSFFPMHFDIFMFLFFPFFICPYFSVSVSLFPRLTCLMPQYLLSLSAANSKYKRKCR